MTLQLYDNGVHIRTLVTAEEVTTLINRDVAVDEVNKKIYILNPAIRLPAMRTARSRRMNT